MGLSYPAHPAPAKRQERLAFLRDDNLIIVEDDTVVVTDGSYEQIREAIVSQELMLWQADWISIPHVKAARFNKDKVITLRDEGSLMGTPTVHSVQIRHGRHTYWWARQPFSDNGPEAMVLHEGRLGLLRSLLDYLEIGPSFSKGSMSDTVWRSHLWNEGPRVQRPPLWLFDLIHEHKMSPRIQNYRPGTYELDHYDANAAYPSQLAAGVPAGIISHADEETFLRRKWPFMFAEIVFAVTENIPLGLEVLGFKENGQTCFPNQPGIYTGWAWYSEVEAARSTGWYKVEILRGWAWRETSYQFADAMTWWTKKEAEAPKELQAWVKEIRNAGPGRFAISRFRLDLITYDDWKRMRAAKDEVLELDPNWPALQVYGPQEAPTGENIPDFGIIPASSLPPLKEQLFILARPNTVDYQQPQVASHMWHQTRLNLWRQKYRIWKDTGELPIMEYIDSLEYSSPVAIPNIRAGAGGWKHQCPTGKTKVFKEHGRCQGAINRHVWENESESRKASRTAA